MRSGKDFFIEVPLANPRHLLPHAIVAFGSHEAMRFVLGLPDVEMMRSRSFGSRQWMMPGRQLEANEELENITWWIRAHATVKL